MIIAVNFPIKTIGKKKPEKIRASTGFKLVNSANTGAMLYQLHSHGTVALLWLSGLCVPMTPRAMPAGVFTPLVGPPKPERSRCRVQTKVSPSALQVWGLGLRLTTSSCKKNLLRKRQRLYQLSYEATHWERDQFVEFISSRKE